MFIWVCLGLTSGQTDAPILIYLGSTTARLYTIQLAKLAGLKVVTTVSPKSHDVVKEYGADDVFYDRSRTAVEDIIRAYPNIDRALDCFSEDASTNFCADVVRKNRGWVVTLLDAGEKDPYGVRVEFWLGYSVFNAEFQWLPPLGPKFHKRPADHEAFRRFYAALPEIAPKLKVPPLKRLDGGLESFPTGLDLVRQGKVSGTKLVTTIF